MANRGTSPTHGASAVAPALTLFSAGGSGSTGTAAKTTGRTGASVGGRGPLDDNVMVAALADEARACEDKVLETHAQVRRETLGALRALEKDIAKDDW
eukprot:CAMPEP_0181371504 /NCGR_PEP_ID=MMETSP1106-20121128/14125_1 /TAXON_ID=81844 /ORGANISM="Mantoniella antarctica, Strain SL-175" /LENGTH=97 /DNA_ID=CAMNT_0023488629 /DNA_START=171 /DNA_END=461 /DNA_ORIENTATION=+